MKAEEELVLSLGLMDKALGLLSRNSLYGGDTRPPKCANVYKICINITQMLLRGFRVSERRAMDRVCLRMVRVRACGGV